MIRYQNGHINNARRMIVGVGVMARYADRWLFGGRFNLHGQCLKTMVFKARVLKTRVLQSVTYRPECSRREYVRRLLDRTSHKLAKEVRLVCVMVIRN